MSGSATQVGIAAVGLMSIASILLGTALAAVLARHGVHRLRWAQLAGAAVAVLSAVAPLSSSGGSATGALLAVLHLITGASYVLAVQAARRRSEATVPAPTPAAAVR